ncbi:MAG: acyltransferase [Chlorobi bacterium]|nr:acyltransferase [Chlorobiota bacterium]
MAKTISQTSRNRTADLLKGVAVILMIQVHLTELFARQDIYDSLLGSISLFLGGPPAAPVFMAVMGYYIAVSRRSARQMVIRGIKLIVLGLVLNIGLNFHLLIKIYTGAFQIDPLPYIFGVDILFLAGLSIIFLGIMKRFFKFKLIPYVALLVLVFAFQYLLQNVIHASTTNYFLAFFYGEGSWWSYFSFIPWLIYPLTGYLFFILQQPAYEKIRAYYKYVVILSSLVVFVFFNYGLKVSADLPAYYHHGFVFYLYSLCFLIFWLFIMNTLAKLPENRVSGFLEWTGINVTAAYVIQWLIIGNTATAIYKTQGLAALVLWFFVIVALMSAGILAWNRLKSKNNEKYLLRL